MGHDIEGHLWILEKGIEREGRGKGWRKRGRRDLNSTVRRSRGKAV